MARENLMPDELLVEAVLSRDAGAAERAHARDADPNVRAEDGDPILFKAVSQDDLDMVQLLLRKGADAGGTDGGRPKCPAHLRLRPIRGRRRNSGGASLPRRVSGGDRRGWSHSIRHRRRGRVWPRLGTEAPPGSAPRRGPHPARRQGLLRAAVRSGDAASVREALDRTDPWAELPLAGIVGGEDVVALLLGTAPATVPCELLGTALRNAAHHGHPSVVAQLLKAGADPNYRGTAYRMTPLECVATGSRATEDDLAHAAKLLLDAGTDQGVREEERNRTLRQLARAHGRHEVARLLDPIPGEPPFDRDTLSIQQVALVEHHDGAESWRFLWRPNDVTVPFILETGPARDSQVREFTAREAWERLPRLLTAIGGAWLLPILERMADGQYPSYAKIIELYRSHHGGLLPSVTGFSVVTARISP